MAHVVNDDLVAFVRLTEGGTVKLHAGDTVPPEADLNHVADLVEAGVLTSSGDGTKPNSADAILADVGDDAVKAQTYLDEELAADKPRKTLVAGLEAVIRGNGKN